MITTNLQQLLTKYQDIFARPKDDLGQTLVQHRINTGTVKLLQQAPMRLPLGKQEIEKAKIDNETFLNIFFDSFKFLFWLCLFVFMFIR
jgi:hypothetical protein